MNDLSSFINIKTDFNYLLKLCFLQFGLVLLAISGYSQTPAIRGKIVDAESNKPISNAAIQLLNLSLGIVSDSLGNFLLTGLTEDHIVLKISHIGFTSEIRKINSNSFSSSEIVISLSPSMVEMQSVVITATRSIRDVASIPARMEVINKSQIEGMPGNTADDMLRFIAGANVDRKNGIFSKNASITMRGLNGAQRTLILMDGVPLNKTDGGSINWSRINPDIIERIEVVKGPVSTLYGSNAMSGAINIITKKPVKSIEGEVKAFYGSYNTMGGRLQLSGSEVKKSKGFFFDVNAFYRRGDGYYLYPDSTRNATDVKNHLWEYLAAAKVGYSFNEFNEMEIEYDYFDDKRGDGVKVFDTEGGYSKYTTNFVRGRYKGGNNKIHFEMNGFYQLEHTIQNKESAKFDVMPPFAMNKYSLYRVDSKKLDRGLWTNASTSIAKNNELTIGIDYKQGNVNSSDNYFTSTDIVTNKGKMSFYGAFVQDEALFFNKKINVTTGFRFDYVRFFSGSYSIADPSYANLYLMNYVGKYGDTAWWSVSPKIGITYEVNSLLNLYVSYGKGFRPPILDDMCRSGSVNKGFKLANPFLKPETLNNYEIGGTFFMSNKIKIEPSLFYSVGNDFQYFVGTGDTIYSGNKPKGILKRENIAKTETYGGEIGVSYQVFKHLNLITNYGHYISKIKNYDISKYQGKDLSGKDLMEVAPNIFNFIATWKSKIATISLAYQFVDKQWIDDENLQASPAHYDLDFKILKRFKNHYFLGLEIQNILNTVYIDEKGVLGPGRYILVEAAYKF